MNTTKPRVAVYALVSTEEQAKEGVSIDTQLSALRKYADSMGWEIAGEYVDPGVSGATDDRPRFSRLMMDARKQCYMMKLSNQIFSTQKRGTIKEIFCLNCRDTKSQSQLTIRHWGLILEMSKIYMPKKSSHGFGPLL